MSDSLTIVLPGREYTAIGACIRFPVLTLEQLGAITRVVTYGDTNDETIERIAEALEGRWSTITFVAKSRGTEVLAALAPLISTSAAIRAIWLTPLFGKPEVRSGAIATGWPSLLVAGTADEAHAPDGFEEVRSKLRASSLVIDNGDHGLEVPGDVTASLQALHDVVNAVMSFAR